jgi:transcriptional regulator with XRE-family HTH domain
MYKNRTPDGRNNVCGRNIKKYREMMSSVPSQRGLAELLQLEGLDIDKNAVQRMESGQRFVTDIELRVIARVLGVSYSDLLDK